MEGVEVKVEVDVYEDDPVTEENESVTGENGFLAEQQLASIINPCANRNLYLVPKDLQQLIVESNPGRAKFTVSSQLNTQLVLDDYVLKKNEGPKVRKVSLLSLERVNCHDLLCPKKKTLQIYIWSPPSFIFLP